MEPGAGRVEAVDTADRRPLVVAVDDDPCVLRALQRLVRGEPYDLLTTDDPDEALRWVGEKQLRLFITDQRMPGMAGSDLVTRVSARVPALPTVILTGYPETAVVLEEKNIRIRKLILKPWDDAALLATLRELLGLEGPGGPRPAAEPDLRIDCRGLTLGAALVRMALLVPAAKARNGCATLEVQNLDRLEGPISRFVVELIRAAAESDVRITLIDGSGCAEMVLRAVGAGPYVVSGPGRTP